MIRRARLPLILLVPFVIHLLVPPPARSSAPHQEPNGWADRRVVVAVDYLGQALLPAGYSVQGTEVGGLSAITYNVEEDIYYVLSDDRSEIDAARFYALGINVADGNLVDGDITFTDVITLTDESGMPFSPGAIDPEGIALTGDGRLYISSEGNPSVEPDGPPFVAEFDLAGRKVAEMVLPGKFLPAAGGTRGVRNNLAFEGLAARPDGQYLITATENALAQDGPAADVGQSSASRILVFETLTRESAGEFVYVTEPVAEAPVPTAGERQNGLADILALDNNGSFLALERSYSEGAGFTIRIFSTGTQNALDVRALDSLVNDEAGGLYAVDPPVSKDLLLNLDDLGLPIITNLEGMALGPKLADGRQTLILVGDNNFHAIIPTQFIVLALTIENIPAAQSALESPRLIDEAEPTGGDLSGEAGDPAIWIHPAEPGDSLIVAAANDGGIHVLDLAGQTLQLIAPEPYGGRAFTSVDVIYNFSLGGQKVDLALATDSANDTLVVFLIDQEERRLSELATLPIPEAILGTGDQEASFDIATYTSPRNGRHYTFIARDGSRLISQLQLSDGLDEIVASVVRTIELPDPAGGEGESPVIPMVADRVLGNLFVGVDNQPGILLFSAEPEGGSSFTVLTSLDDLMDESGITGLALYYGSGSAGYLLASSRANGIHAVTERSGDFQHIGHFVIGESGSIDGVTESNGLDVSNSDLGLAFPSGLLLVQDGTNEPQNLIIDGARVTNNSTNFKFVSWESVADGFSTPLAIDLTGFDPRYPMRVLMPSVSSN